jgi:hypothetical protein
LLHRRGNLSGQVVSATPIGLNLYFKLLHRQRKARQYEDGSSWSCQTMELK